jgi:D-threo-aldose 1-dehydrogenase
MRLSADQYRPFGKTHLRVPPIVFGSGALGDRCRTIPDQTKREICVEWFRHVEPPIVIDTAGRHGAGLALETIGRALERLEIGRDELIIINRLGWTGGHPTFETTAPQPDPLPRGEGNPRTRSEAVQRIGYDGMMRCWEECCRLLGGGYCPTLVSVDDPDQYLAAATSPADRDRRFQDLVDAYRALGELKRDGKVVGVGAGASDWRVIREIDSVIELDWVVLSGSLTIMRHPPEVLKLLYDLAERQVAVINSGLFHGGFLTGGRSFGGRAVRPDDQADRPLLAWRKSFVALCEGHGITPVDACVQFGLSAPGVVAVLLDTSHPDRVAANVAAAARQIPSVFWESMKEEGLLDEGYPYVRQVCT